MKRGFLASAGERAAKASKTADRRLAAAAGEAAPSSLRDVNVADMPRHQKVATLVQVLHRHPQLEHVISKGEGLEVDGHRFDDSVATEALQEWSALRAVEDFRRGTCNALSSVRQSDLRGCEKNIAAVREALASLQAADGPAARVRAAKERAKAGAEEQRHAARAAAEGAREARGKAAEAVERARDACGEALAEQERIGGRMAQLMHQLEQLRAERERVRRKAQQLVDQARAEAEKLEAASQEEQRQHAAVAAADREGKEVEEQAARIARLLSRAEHAAGAVDQAVERRLRELELGFLDWPAEEVAAWLRRLSGGEFAPFSAAFLERGVTGKMLPGLSPDDLMGLGVSDARQRRLLLETIGRLRLRAVTGATVEEPPSELVCPITHEVVEDPVAILGDSQGQAYERSAIERWFADGNLTVPGTGVALPEAADRQLLPLRALARQAKEWRRLRT